MNWDMPPMNAAPPIKQAPVIYSELRVQAFQALGYPGRHPTIIGIDGRDGMGKSSLANWLGWQLGIPAYSLDDYFYAGSQPHSWRTEELIRIINGRLVNGRPVILEGIFLLEALAEIEADPGYLIVVENEHGGSSIGWQQQLDAYFEAFRPRSRANFVVSWSSEEYETLQEARELRRILGDL